ncbi:hypothetical protein C6P45_000729 [Maudiozyma exigua]|uniref:Uncharacterized protein n=1 Tax=Maudiozyma exigua TaxID=34358 RepID=A0A9P6W4T3_MAUEX|nr:hypothetical protein C6P45_000729 [Kazachstania exigua]
MEKTNSQTDTEFDDISSFSSVDSYKPEPFTGTEDGVKNNAEMSKLIKNDTVITGNEHTHGTDQNFSTIEKTKSRDHSDVHSKVSNTTLKKLDSNAVERVVTHNALNDNSETVESLKAKNHELETAALPDINSPLSNASGGNQFPEEYGIETNTGLVKMKTIETLKREKTKESSSSDNTAAQNATNAKIETAVERNRKDIEKYQKHKHEKGVKGFFHRIFD